MDRLIHTALSAMRAAMARQTATANNLANSATTGFRAELAEVRTQWVTGPGLPDRALAMGEVLSADLRAGAVTQTARPLDVAVQDDAMLSVQTRDGDEGYTRRGDLVVAPSGLLTTGDGLPVLGDGGPISVSPADAVRIAEDGSVWATPPGGQPVRIDRLKLASAQGTPIAKGLDGVFRVVGGGVLADDPQARVTPGALEGSNVDAPSALVAMVEAGRTWDAQVKLLTTAREIDGETAALMKLPA